MPGVHTGLRHRTMGFTADPARVHLFHDGQSLLYA
jgi:alpha-glucoside transport system ATP-binding protein